MSIILRASIVGCVLLAAVGCRLVEPTPKGKSPLVPLVGAPDTVTLEIFSAPVPLGDPRIAALWTQVDEQQLPAELRQKLARNGLMAGIAGPRVPAPLAEILKLTDERISAEDRTIVPLDSDSDVTLNVLQPPPGKRHEQVLSSVYEQMVLLQNIDGQVRGRTYNKAEGRMAMRVMPESDGRVRLDLIPELHHGEFKNRFSGSEAVLVMKQERPKEVFDELRLTPSLAAGQMLVVTCLPDRPGSIGHYFFGVPGSEKPMQKLYVIRVSQAGPDRAFWDGPKQGSGELSSDSRE